MSRIYLVKVSDSVAGMPSNGISHIGMVSTDKAKIKQFVIDCINSYVAVYNDQIIRETMIADFVKDWEESENINYINNRLDGAKIIWVEDGENCYIG